MKKMLRKRKGDLSGVTFTIIMIVIVLLAVPSFRGLMHDNGQASQQLGTQVKNVTAP